MERLVKTVCKCSYCNKVTLNKGAMIRHEKFCKKNPYAKPLCYDCIHYEPIEGSLDEHGTYKECYRQAQLNGKTVNFTVGRCTLGSQKSLLYNSLKKSKNDIHVITYGEAYRYSESIDPDGGIILRHISKKEEVYGGMPTKYGCPNFKEIE